MLCAAGWAKFSVLYEFTSLEDRRKNFEEKHEAMGLTDDKWTHKIHNYTVHAPGSPSVAEGVATGFIIGSSGECLII